MASITATINTKINIADIKSVLERNRKGMSITNAPVMLAAPAYACSGYRSDDVSSIVFDVFDALWNPAATSHTYLEYFISMFNITDDSLLMLVSVKKSHMALFAVTTQV